MSLLFPKFTPVQAVLYLVSLVVCFVFRGESGDILFSIEPVTAGVLIAGALAAGAAPQIIKGVQAKKAMKRYDKSAEAKALRQEQKEARKRLKKGDYGLSEAEMRRGVGETRRTYEADTKTAAANIARDSQNPFAAGRKRKLTDALRAGSADAAAKSRSQQQALHSQIRAAEQTADRGIIQSAAAQRQAAEQGIAAANTAIGSGIAGGIGTGIGAGTALYAAGAFNPNRPAQAQGAAEKLAAQPMATTPPGQNPAVGSQ
mgnify:CR=1 FL=1|tara:strand:+ start:35620 stop:36396 length:777 start_codon:yes stop_codon:yes gene_type:complete